MKKYHSILIVALLGFVLAGCGKNETPAPGTGDSTPAPAAQATPAPAVPVETLMRQTYGFAAQMPADTAAFTDFYQLGKLLNDLKGSKMWASIKANPLVSEKLNSESFQQSLSQMRSNPGAVKWKAILKEALGSEAFMAFAPGSEAKVHAWMELNGDIRAARIQALLTGGVNAVNNPKYLIAAIVPRLKDLDVPPMILGFKVTSQKEALDAELAQAVKSLPPFVEQTAFTTGGGQFTSLAVTLGKALTEQQQSQVKMMTGMFITDPQVAETTYKSLMDRRIEIAYGQMGDYFLISIGPDHSHLKFADTYAASLLARPDVQKAADFTSKPVLSFSWTSQQMMEALQQGFELMAAYDGIKEQLTETLSQSDIAKLEGDLKRIDTEGRAVFNPPVTSAVGIEYRDHGLRGEVYGGIKFNPPAAPMKFAQVPVDSTFIWMDGITDPVRSEAVRVWFEDLCSTGWDTFQRLGLPRMSPMERKSFAGMQAMVVPNLIQFYKITRDEFARGLGLEKAFAMDLNGEIPNAPMIPPEYRTGGKMMRLALLADVKDRALLARSWDDYFQLANTLAPLAGDKFADGIPQPENENVDGVALWYYKVLPSGDVMPNVAVTDKTFVAGMSRSYSLELSKAAGAPAAGGKPLILDFRVNFKPVYDTADKWLALAAQEPDAFFGDNEDEADEFKKSEPNIVSLIESLRVIDGLSFQIYQENGVPRISTVIRWDEK